MAYFRKLDDSRAYDENVIIDEDSNSILDPSLNKKD